MNYATIRVSGSCATVVGFRDIPTGTVGGTITIEYADPAWNSLVKTGVFRGCCTRDVLNIGSIVEIPHEVLAHPDRLTFGIWGYDPNTGNVTPTFWAELGRIRPGADPSGDESANPTPPVWAQLQSMIGDLNQLDTAAKENLVAAINEALTKGGGAVDEETVQRIVQEYLEANPPAGGQDGTTPHIGDNGNWYIGDTDTGAPSRGERGEAGEAGPAGPQGKDGATGPAGRDGEDGKSAYQYAIESGYTATEKQFSKDLSLVGTLSERDVRSYGVYPGEDCTVKLQAAVLQGGKFYFPDGVYKFSGVTITEDTVFVLAPNAMFHSDSTEFMIKAYSCSFSMYGGKVSSGTEYPERHETPYNDDSRKMIGHGLGATVLNNTGIIALYGCHNCVIDGVSVPYGSNGSVFTVIGDRSGKNTESEKVTVNGKEITIGRSREIRFLNCAFTNFLLSAIHVLYGNDNILVDGCNFTNSLRAKGIDYGYCVCTGVRDVGQDSELYFTPTNGYVIRNCYVENCEGTALDTHGATNVIYEGNKLIDCDSFITAYWDCERVKTAEGWVMENIIVRNNFCRTTKAFNYAGNIFAHNPFMLHSNAPLSKTTGKMRNLIVENNYVESNWYYVGSSQWCMVEIYYVDNIVFRNNVFKTTATSAIVSNVKHCRNVDIDNITLIGTFVQAFEFATSICRLGRFDCTKATFTNAVFANTNYLFSVIDTDSLSVTPAIDNVFSGWQNTLMRYGQLLQEVDGIAPLDGTWSTYKGFIGKKHQEGTKRVSCTGNVVKMLNGHFLPGTWVCIASTVYRVVDVESEVVVDNGKKVTYFYYTLDSAPTAANLGQSSYLLLYCPYKDRYADTAEE